MFWNKYSRFHLTICSLFFALAAMPQLQAQTYADVSLDPNLLYVDLYGEATAPSGGCPSSIYIYDTLNAVRAGANAVYPVTAHVAQNQPNVEGANYPWSREIIHVGLQRGGKCGPYSDTTVSLSIGLGVSVNIYQFSTVGSDGLVYYYPIPNCNTKCRHSLVSGPLSVYQNYEYVIENFAWYRYSTAPTDYYCAKFAQVAKPSNTLPSTGLKCFDTTLP
jgi:hypothetical protein